MQMLQEIQRLKIVFFFVRSWIPSGLQQYISAVLAKSKVKTIPVIIELKNKKLSATINAYALYPPLRRLFNV